jgi:tRNA threonylcarbamoyladenosine biosynthesis protein TsaB
VNDSWILALETTVPHATLALAHQGTVVAERSFESERSQECDLFPPLRDLLEKLPDGRTLATVIVGTGPGSYNGARVGIAAAQAVAQVHGAPVAGLCSFEATAEALDHPLVHAVGDARRGSFFLLPLIEGQAQTPPQLFPGPEFSRTLTRLPEVPVITFESPERLPPGSGARQTTPDARGLLAAWWRRSPAEQKAILSSPPEAFYLRPPHITRSKKTGRSGRV